MKFFWTILVILIFVVLGYWLMQKNSPRVVPDPINNIAAA